MSPKAWSFGRLLQPSESNCQSLQRCIKILVKSPSVTGGKRCHSHSITDVDPSKQHTQAQKEIMVLIMYVVLASEVLVQYSTC